MIDSIDLRVCAHCVWFYLKNAKARWNRLDSLYAERAHTMQELARMDFQVGKLDEQELNVEWDKIDRELSIYDGKKDDRRMLSQYLEDLIKRLGQMVYGTKK